MFKLSRMTDYGVVALGYMAERTGHLMTAPEVADATGLPLPTVSKLLKQLAKDDIISAQRGAQGGYLLERRASDISVAEIIACLDGPVALTACVDGAEGSCQVETLCPMRGRWDRINLAVKDALSSVSLAEIAAEPAIPDFIGETEETTKTERFHA